VTDPVFATYSPPLPKNGERRVVHVRLAGRRSYLCDPAVTAPPPFRVLQAETLVPDGKVCGSCGRSLNALIDAAEVGEPPS
jgi:hypothetical protein